MADASGIQPPYLDPSQYPNYADVQRKQLMAQMLMQAFQQNANSPNPQPVGNGAYTVQPKRGIMQGIAPILSAALAGKAMKDSNTAQQNYFQGLNAPAPAQTAPYDASAASQAEQTAPGIAATPQSQQQPKGLVAPTPTTNPMIPNGMSPRTAQQMLNFMGPQEYAKTFVAPQYPGPTDLERKLTLAGITDPQLRQQIVQQSIAKENYQAPTAVRGNETLLDPVTRKPFFTGPTENGVVTSWDGAGNPSVSNAPGSLAATQAESAAKTAGTQSQTPIKLGVDASGKDVYGFPTPPAAAASTPTASRVPGVPRAGGGVTASPAVLTAQEDGAKAGQTYATELAKNSTGATEVRRSLSELRNLASQASPAATNSAKGKLGAMLIAGGADPGWVTDKLGVDTSAIQAAQKQTATLAVNTIHSMTSRGTNFDLDTFMRNNPNLDLADPAAFNKVADYMDQKAKQEIDKQRDFVSWKKGVSPDEWETGHTAHWNEKQNALIDQGLGNSRRPAPTGTSLEALEAEAKKRGLKPQADFGVARGGW